MPIRKNLPREEFTSKGGSYICLGHFKNKDSNTYTTDYNPHFVTYNALDAHGARTQPVQFEKGLSTTKFGAGFNRRNESSIRNPSKEEIVMRQNFKDSSRLSQSLARSAKLQAVDNRNGFDIITGTKRGDKPIPEPKAGMKKFDLSMPSNEIIKRGKSVLRDVQPFFLPQGSGKQHDYRQDMLYREGLNQKKYTSILQLGKNDIPSYGIEDNFSKAEYMKTNEATKTGLYEKRMPGKYTPRKIPGHPSADDNQLKLWTREIELKQNIIRTNPITGE